MGILEGLSEYIAANYRLSVFDQALGSGEPMVLHCHGGEKLEGTITANLRYDVAVADGEGAVRTVPKVAIKLLYAADCADRARPLISIDKKIRALGLGPIPKPGARNHIKNRSLFPLMKEREVVFFTLLEGEVLRGIIAAFSRYEITVHLKGGVPVTLLRHAVHDLRDKKGMCFLKSTQELLRAWEKSALFVTRPEKG